jgi:phage terminase large subunit-like protein
MNNKEEIRQLDIEAARIGLDCIDSFYFFFKTFWPEFSSENYIDNFHIELICNTLQKYGEMIARGDELRKTVIINVPPGSSKSSLCTVAFPLYMWLIKPSCTTVNISYSADLSKDHQELSKDIPSSLRWKKFFDNIFTLKYGQPLTIPISNKNKVQNNYGGKRFNTSTGGALTGKHCDIIIEDDPLNPEQAHSDAERENSIRFHDKTVSTRKKNDNCYLNIIIAQRLHEEDICGHVLKKKLDIDHICLPGEITANTPVLPEYAKEYYQDGILNPVRKGRLVLNDLKESLGADGYAIQVLQLPFDLEAQDIKPEMFKRIHAKELPNDVVWDVFVDGAFTDKKGVNDPTGIALVSKIGRKLYVRKYHGVYKKLPDLVKFIKELGYTGKFNELKSRIFVEPKASGYPLVQYLEAETEFNLVLIGQNNKREAKLVQEGKRARHEMIKSKAESGMIVLVEDGDDDSWIDDYIVEICGFPRAAHDETVDVTGYSINHYYMKESSFLEEWAIKRLENNITGSLNIMLTSMEVLNKNGSKSLSVGMEENDSGDIQLFDYPNNSVNSTKYNHMYIVTTVIKSESERGGKSVILVFDRLTNEVVSLWEEDITNTRKIAKKSLEMAYYYDNAKLVIAVKKSSGQANNEELDLSHSVIQELRKHNYNKLHIRLTVNNIKKTRDREYGFEVNNSTKREIYINLKDRIETNQVKALPKSVFEDIEVLERKKEDGSIDGQEGREVNTALAYAISLKVSDEWTDKVSKKNNKRDKWL